MRAVGLAVEVWLLAGDQEGMRKWEREGMSGWEEEEEEWDGE
jgi:hypothetical protein